MLRIGIMEDNSVSRREREVLFGFKLPWKDYYDQQRDGVTVKYTWNEFESQKYGTHLRPAEARYFVFMQYQLPLACVLAQMVYDEDIHFPVTNKQ